MDSTDSAGGTGRLTVVECRNIIYESLIRNGKIELLKSHLSDILRFSGWDSLMRERCTENIQKEGFEHVNFSHMLCDVIPFGRAQVPPEIRESLRNLLRTIAESHFTIVEDSRSINLEMEHASETYLPFIYQSHDKLPDYGDYSIFTQQPDPVPSPPESSPSPPASPLPRFTDFSAITGTSSPNNLSREIGGIVLLDRVDLEKENGKLEKEKAEQREKELKERERQERDRVRQELEKERLDRLERERQEQKEHERQERKDRELQELKDRERTEHRERESSKERRERQTNFQQSLSVPSSPSTPRPDKKNALTEATMMMKLAQVKQPPSLASTLITATAAIAGKKSKHINLNSDNDDDDEDDEELMDI